MKQILTGVLLIISIFRLTGSDGYRRSPGIDIINYTFSLLLSDSSDMIYGRSVITMRFKEVTVSMQFDLKNTRVDGKGMVVDSVLYNGGIIEWTHEGNRITVIPNRPANKDETGTLGIVYHGIPSDGLIISNNKFHSRTFFSDHWPDRASNYLPCIDHPYDKATVDFIITAPSHYVVVANGYPVEESHSGKDMKLTHWREDVPIPVKVMGFGAAHFDIQLAGNPENVPVWTYVFTENRKEGFFDYSPAVKPVTFFSRLIGEYPYEKLANVQSKTIFGGLENAGCIFYSEKSVTGKGRVEGLLAHEIAHQWFGNSVTENDWHHIWLSEGFATYLTSVYQEMNYGEDRLAESMKSARERVLKEYLRSPGSVIDTTITDLMKLLSANSYQKGAWVLHMLRREIGEDPFWKGMRAYYERFRDKNAMTEDFIGIMEKVSGKDLNSFFTQWLYYKGQPDLKITNRPSMKKGMTDIIIRQRQQILFRFPLELLINSQNGSSSEHLQISERTTKVTVKAEGVKEIIPDPQVNLLFRQISN
jgi:aminopeptidase N